jgi:DNA-binding transcriptional regulator YbjK
MRTCREVTTRTMPKLDEQIATLQDRLKQLKLRQQRTEQRRQAIEARRERKAETRRRILIGGIVLAKLRQGDAEAAIIRSWIEEAVTREEDRALFELVGGGRDGRTES